MKEAKPSTGVYQNNKPIFIQVTVDIDACTEHIKYSPTAYKPGTLLAIDTSTCA